MEDTIETISNVSNILEINDKLSNIKPRQQGGFVFGLISAIFKVFVMVGKALLKILHYIISHFFMFYIRDENGELTIPYTDSKTGLFWKFLGVCLKVSIYLVIFALGGIGVTIYGIIYLYTRLIREFTKNKAEK